MPQTVPQAVQACHDLLRWMIPHLDKFPRTRRFTLGERLETGLLDVLTLLVEAAYSQNKGGPLRQANLRLEVVRHVWRLTFELKVVATRQYEHGARLLDDIGRQIGGWLRSQGDSQSTT
ncbi:MAG: diversity-generating retroelement protein Avd [Nitrospira sp.]|nr:diversity-generating retroelement protein Avd [Nitrospira sp.]